MLRAYSSYWGVLLCDYSRAACCKGCVFQSCTSISSPVCKAVPARLVLQAPTVAEMGFVQAAVSISLAWSSGLHSKWEFFASTGVNKDGEERRLLLQLKTHIFKREINTRFQLWLSKNDLKTLGCPFVLSKLSSGMQFQVEKLRTLLWTVE